MKSDMLSLTAVGETHLRNLKEQVFPDAVGLALGKIAPDMTAIALLSQVVAKNMLNSVAGAMVWMFARMHLSARKYRENELTIWVEQRPTDFIRRTCTV